jgi:integrase
MRGHLHPYELKSGQRQWAVVIYEGKKPGKDGKLRDSHRWVRGFATKREAQTELTKLLRSKDDGSYVEPSKETLGSYLDRWLATHAEPNLAAKTVERYRQLVEVNIKPKIGGTPLAKLQPIAVSEFYSWSLTSGHRRKTGGLSPRTVRHIHRLLHAALKQAVKWQLRQTNPYDAVEAPKPVAKEMSAVDEDGSAWLIQAALGMDLYIPIMYALSTGLRRGEILGQRWQDVDFASNRLFVAQSLEQTKRGGLKFKIPKGKKRRALTMSPLLAEALKAHGEEQARRRKLFGADYHSDLDLIVALPDGSPWPPDRFTDRYVAFSKKVGLKGVRFHDLRHSNASQLLRQGVPVKVVSARLGHSNATVTLNTYAHVLAGDDERAAEIMERQLRIAIAKRESTRAN